MQETTPLDILGSKRRQQYFLRLVLLLLIGSAFTVGFLNFYLGKPLLNGFYNIGFSIIFTFIFLVRHWNIEIALLLGALFFQVFIFGHAYYLLPGKQIEAGFGVLTSILPIFLTGKRLWGIFILNFILYHLVLWHVQYENIFMFQYGFYIVIFIMINAIIKENQQYELALLVQRDKIKRDAETLRELDELKNQFFANISHELRTPLTLILSPIDTILKSNDLSNRNYTYMQLMQQNGQKLLRRINELLELSRLGANKLEVVTTPVNIYTVTKQIAASYEGAANLKSVELNYINEIEEDTILKLDHPKIEMILSNYLSNALKFTPKGGTITLHIKKIAQNLQISVQDTGIGIPKSALHRVFDRFYQVKRTDYYEGTGIGLSLCKELAELQQGKVWVESKMNQGSTFYVQLPFVETITTAPAQDSIPIVTKNTPSIPAIPSTHNSDRPTILIVEDNADLRTYMQLLLSEKYNVLLAENGQVALERLTGGDEQSGELSPPFKGSIDPCQLIISDIMMPVMDGMTLLKKLKQADKFRHIPVVLLTAQKHTAVKIDALRIGVDDYLTKPFLAEELLARVDNLIENTTQRLQTTVETPPETPKISAHDMKWLKTIEQKILENLGNSQFKLNDLAAVLLITPRSLQQRVKTLTGQTPKKYQRSIQLNYARTKLKSGEIKTVSELSYQLGFEDQHYFSKLYKKEFGISPKQELNRLL